MAVLRVFGGGAAQPVGEEDVREMIRLSNQIADLEAARDALAANVLRRMEGQDRLALGVHRVEVARMARKRAEVTALKIDGVERWRRTVK